MIKRVLQCIILFLTITMYASSNTEATTVIPAEYHPNTETTSPTQKIAYLTFDDGPNKYTTQILNILKEKNGKATFFVIGGKVPHYTKTMQRLIKEGHYIGLHSMSHDVKRLYTGDPSTLIAEMEQTQSIVQQVTKLNTHLVRVPYGSMPYLKRITVTHLYRPSIKCGIGQSIHTTGKAMTILLPYSKEYVIKVMNK